MEDKMPKKSSNRKPFQFEALESREVPAGLVTSQADWIHEAVRVRSAPGGPDGTGIRIGIISDSYDISNHVRTRAADDVRTGDLPAGVVVVREAPAKIGDVSLADIVIDEGRAMMQLIHDIAPGATLVFATALSEQGVDAGIARAVRELADPALGNCSIIVDDVSGLAEPFFQDGLAAQAVDDALARYGVSYFTGPGDFINNSYESTTFKTARGSLLVDGKTVTGDFYDFRQGVGRAPDVRQTISIQDNQELALGLQWSDPFYTRDKVRTDLDIYLINPLTQEVVASSTTDNRMPGADGFATPLEMIEFQNRLADTGTTTFELVIQQTGGPAPDRIKYVILSNVPVPVEYATNSGTTTGHAAARGAINVGAVHYFNQTAPSSTTSAGPFTVLFDTSGRRLKTPEVRLSPDVAAVDGTDTTFLPVEGQEILLAGEGNSFPNFFGTSSSAPVAAAIAALIKQHDPKVTPKEIRQRLIDSSRSVSGDPGWDSRTGYGLIDAYAAVFGKVKAARPGFVDTFDNGDLPARYEVTTTGSGAVYVTDRFNPGGGKSVVLDALNDFYPSRDELTLRLDVSKGGPVALSFDVRPLGPTTNPMPDSFTRSADADGVAFSVDGGTKWYRLTDLAGRPVGATQQFNVDLSAEAARRGLKLGADVRVRFQTVANGRAEAGKGGLAIDRIQVSRPEVARAELADEGKTLVIKGTSSADVLTVTQDDQAGTVTVMGIWPSPAVFRSNVISTVSAKLGDGDDRFEYKTIGDVRFTKKVGVDLGAGDDTSVIRWADDGAVAKANLSAVVSGGIGDDAIGFRIGSLAPNVSVSLRADGGDGNDALGVQSLAPGRGSKLDVALSGGTGNDNIGTYSTGDLAVGGMLSYDLVGATGDDSISLNAAGRVAGNFTARLDGGAGNDSLALNSVDVAGPKKLYATLIGGSGDDQFVTLAYAKTSDVIVDGRSGSDLGLLADGVTARSVEQSRAPTNYELHPGPLPSFNPVLPTSTLKRDGRTVEYYSAGKSKPGDPVVVLITGFGGTIDYWQTIPGSLATKGQVIAVNRPGYGKSSAGTSNYALDTIEDIRAVLKTLAPGRPAILVGHSLGGLYANLFARLHPNEVGGVVFVDATAPELIARIDDAGIPYGGLGDPNDAELRLEPIGVGQEILGAVSLARSVLASSTFPKVPVISLRADVEDLLADDLQADAWYEALGALGTPGETRRVPNSGHHIQYDRPDAVVLAVADLNTRVGTSAESQFVTDVLADVAQRYNIPGITAAVVVGGRVVTGAAGVREAGTATPVQAGDAFHLGSTTKALTATLAGVLVDKGVVRWNTTIAKAFPELKGKIRQDYQNVTLAQLLSHTGGIVNDGDILASPDAFPGLVEKYARYIGQNPATARYDFLKVLLNLTPTNPSGQFHYSNFGYSVAGAILERLTGRSYESLMERYLFGPLGIATATFLEPGTPQTGTPRPVGTDINGQPLSADDTLFQLNAVTIQNPAGSNLSMSAADWAKLIRIHLGQTVNGVRLLRPETLAFLQKPYVQAEDIGTQYALGWFTNIPSIESGLGPAIYHGGQDGPWWATEAVVHKDTQFATLIMANRIQDGLEGVPYQAISDSAFAEIRQRLEARFAPKVATVTTLTATTATRVAGDPVVLTAKVNGGPAAVGLVTFSAGGQVLGSAPVIAGKAMLTTTDIPVGTNKVTAAFAGDSGHKPSLGMTEVKLSAPSADSQFISSILAEVAKKYRIPGLSAAVIVGEAVTAGSAGVRQAGGSDPVQTGDRFANGSTTKAMTATLAGVLVEKKLIRWDSTVVQVFPELKGKIRPELENATLEIFLRHRSGLIGGSSDDSSAALIEKATSVAGAPPDVARREVLSVLLNEPLAVKPGDFYYSNAGYSVAAAMLERVTGIAYETLMQKYVFGPLGMTSATFDTTGDIGARTPVGTDPATGTPVTFDSEQYLLADPPILNPAGVGLRMNVADWARFVRIHLGQTVNGVRLLMPETLTRLHSADPRPLQPGLENFGFGYASGWGTRPANWDGRDLRLGSSLEHDGSDNYWLAEVEAFPKANFAVLVMANTTIDDTGKDIEATAFAEIKRRLTVRFAPVPSTITGSIKR
jgi:CubicO group peptidase (beta-lactamase class C family)/pimeloyl-ACP methyl ester carboxylesterase